MLYSSQGCHLAKKPSRIPDHDELDRMQALRLPMALARSPSLLEACAVPRFGIVIAGHPAYEPWLASLDGSPAWVVDGSSIDWGKAVLPVARTAADARQWALVNGCRTVSRGWQLVLPWTS